MPHRLSHSSLERQATSQSGAIPLTLTGFFIADAPVQVQGRVELLWYLREQTVSHSYHRYGNLGARAREPRAEPL